VPEHVVSAGSWQEPDVPVRTQRSPRLQSLESVHAMWQRPNAQMSGMLQSLLIEQVLASPAAADLLLQLAMVPANPRAKPTRTTTPKIRR
jgi:hypothetical protein